MVCVVGGLKSSKIHHQIHHGYHRLDLLHRIHLCLSVSFFLHSFSCQLNLSGQCLKEFRLIIEQI